MAGNERRKEGRREREVAVGRGTGGEVCGGGGGEGGEGGAGEVSVCA